MRILVTNDDGIHAPGLKVCEAIARALSDDVWIVAPETDQSGVSHSLSLSNPLRLRKVADKHFAVTGTPTDCVIMGIKAVLPAPPDLVLSGVNRGQNLADDVTYSGTIAAAMEGTLLGVPSIALSQAYSWDTRANPRWHCGESHGPDVIRRILKAGIAPKQLINVNFPDREPAEVAGIDVTVQATRGEDFLSIDERVDGRGNTYYWIGFKRGKNEPASGTDLSAVAKGFISITPLHLDLTDHGARQRLAHELR